MLVIALEVFFHGGLCCAGLYCGRFFGVVVIMLVFIVVVLNIVFIVVIFIIIISSNTQEVSTQFRIQGKVKSNWKYHPQKTDSTP